MPTLIDHARSLRKNHTEAESHLWYLIRNRRLLNFKFKRQVPIGPYIVDFLCSTKKLIIELDGGQHIDQQHYDAKRTLFLESMGYKVIRFWNHEILCDTNTVLDEIFRELCD